MSGDKIRSIFNIAEELVKRQDILLEESWEMNQYGQDDEIYKLIRELKDYLYLGDTKYPSDTK